MFSWVFQICVFYNGIVHYPTEPIKLQSEAVKGMCAYNEWDHIVFIFVFYLQTI